LGRTETTALDVDPLALLRERPDECANVTLTTRQKIVGGALIAAAAVVLWYRLVPFLLVLNAAAIVFYTVQSLYKFYLVWVAMGRPVEIQVSDEEITALRDQELPTYTLLIPLHREAEVLPELVKSLSALDYPPEKLDIRLLLEEDDADTIAAAEELALQPPFRALVIPDSDPKTKPKACNYGLYTCDSELLVIYDAEDRPEPDQLRKAVAAFAKLPDEVICLQAKLNYYNPRQNLLTKWFTAEYSVWFDLFLPGLTASRAPIPLGGTSNHFKVAELKELGGWDPFNVTEDCDLGVRLHKHGHTTAVVDSTTWEEANSKLMGWIRQRSRWCKGYIQTYLVHMRHPVALFRQLGLRDWFSFQMTIGGMIFCLLVNPVYWSMTALWFVTRWELVPALFPLWVFALGAVCLSVGNFAFVYLMVVGCMKRGHYDLVKYAVVCPVYWLLMSIGGWKAALQIVSRPHYWEKTTHGLTQGTQDSGERAGEGREAGVG
jgi:cellulose synthase/poly-beta-1,6-N-acetylglucosamine synthase-like glycosyltransferase